MSVREILLATDFSDLADEAVRVGRDYAQRFGARVHLFHTFWSGEYGVTELFARAREALGSGTTVVIASSAGDPAEEIVRYATAHDIDLIVLGTQAGRG